MAYVDLNPIRAKMAKTPETSEHMSIKKRIESAKEGKQPKCLLRFSGSPRKLMPKGLPFEFKNYLQLVEQTGQCIRVDKRGSIDSSQPILARLNICPENWLKLTTQFTKSFRGAVGREQSLQSYCDHVQLQRRSNLTQCQRLFA